MDRATADGAGSIPPRATPNCRVVSTAPTRPGENAAPHADEEAEGALRLLRHYLERERPVAASPSGGTRLASRARAQIATALLVENDAKPVEAIPASKDAHRSSVRHAANPASLKSRMPEIGTSGSVGAPGDRGYPTPAREACGARARSVLARLAEPF